MIYRNNLSDSSSNSYFEVVESFDVFIPIGRYDTNTWIESSRMIGTLYKKLSLNPGDYLADLFGGVFVSYQDKLVPASIALSEKHPFEKVYAAYPEVYPVEKLKKIISFDKEMPFSRDIPDVSEPPAHKYYGRSLNAID
jgi:hypothetical protein